MGETNSVDYPTTVSFEHKFFAMVDGITFVQDDRDGECVMCMPLEGTEAKLPFNGIKNEFKIAPESPDWSMLDVIEKSLQFVPVIKVGDAVPSELHSGQASWEITDRHRNTARARLSLQLVSWMSGDEEVIIDSTQLEMLAEDPVMKARVNDAFSEAAVKLGMQAEQREDVIDLVNGLGEELAYIEALREKLGDISIVEERIESLRDIYKGDFAMTETINQVGKLCSIPMSEFRQTFDEIDAQTGEIIAVLKNMASQVKFIRETRDSLFQRFWAWNDIVESWQRQPARRSRDSEHLLNETYRFLARRYLPQNEWELFSKAQDEAAKGNTESLWG